MKIQDIYNRINAQDSFNFIEHVSTWTSNGHRVNPEIEQISNYLLKTYKSHPQFVYTGDMYRLIEIQWPEEYRPTKQELITMIQNHRYFNGVQSWSRTIDGLNSFIVTSNHSLSDTSLESHVRYYQVLVKQHATGISLERIFNYIDPLAEKIIDNHFGVNTNHDVIRDRNIDMYNFTKDAIQELVQGKANKYKFVEMHSNIRRAASVYEIIAPYVIPNIEILQYSILRSPKYKTYKSR